MRCYRFSSCLLPLLVAAIQPAFGSPIPIFDIPAAASSFGLLGGSVSDTGSSTVVGNVGATSTITGFPPGTASGFACTSTSAAPCTAGNNIAVTAAYDSIFGAGGAFSAGLGLAPTGTFTTATSQTLLG